MKGKVIIAGGRGVTDPALVFAAMQEAPFEVREVISGGAQGADTLGEKWAAYHSLPVTRVPARWDLHGKAAGPIRNREMAEYADACVCVWDGRSPGTRNMIEAATRLGVPVFVYPVLP